MVGRLLSNGKREGFSYIETRKFLPDDVVFVVLCFQYQNGVVLSLHLNTAWDPSPALLPPVTSTPFHCKVEGSFHHIDALDSLFCTYICFIYLFYFIFGNCLKKRKCSDCRWCWVFLSLYALSSIYSLDFTFSLIIYEKCYFFLHFYLRKSSVISRKLIFYGKKLSFHLF